jgi:hypothetical protein
LENDFESTEVAIVHCSELEDQKSKLTLVELRKRLTVCELEE